MSSTSSALRRLSAPAALVLALTLGPVVLGPPAGATVAVSDSGARTAAAEQAPSTTGGVRRKLFRITSKSADEGGARVKGTLKFRSAGRVSVVGRVNDLCPGDGDWGSAMVIAVMDTGEWDVINRHDTGGCTSAPLHFRHTFTQADRIVRVQVRACVHPTGRGFSHKCTKRNYANPHA